MNKVAVNICVQISCGHKFLTRLHKYLGLQSLDRAVRVDLAFEETTKLPSQIESFSFHVILASASQLLPRDLRALVSVHLS